MPKKRKPKEAPRPVFLSPNQVGTLIEGAVQNLIDMQIHADPTGYKFLIIPRCIFEEDCIPVNQEPESDEEYFQIFCAHLIPELGEYVEMVIAIKSQDDGTYHRGFSTIYINEDNMADFIDALQDLEEHWAEVNDEMAQQEELENKTKGKNIVAGNGTVN